MGIVDVATDENAALHEPPDWCERLHVEGEAITGLATEPEIVIDDAGAVFFA